jgi:hypothetical protein
MDNELWIDLFDPNLDSKAGLLYMKWSNEDIRNLYISLIIDALETFRKIDFESVDSTSDGNEILRWILSYDFDLICSSVGLVANDIRCQLPKIISEYHPILPVETQSLLTKLDATKHDVLDVDLNTIEQLIDRQL